MFSKYRTVNSGEILVPNNVPIENFKYVWETRRKQRRRVACWQRPLVTAAALLAVTAAVIAATVYLVVVFFTTTKDTDPTDRINTNLTSQIGFLNKETEVGT